jgi:hypothetical protein
MNSTRENRRSGQRRSGADDEMRRRLDALEREIEEHRRWLRDEPLLQRAARKAA